MPFFVHYTNDLLIIKHIGVYYNENYNLSSRLKNTQ